VKNVLFPLPLTPFERYYWADNRPDYPTTFPIELSFFGTLNEPAFRAAVLAAQGRHPLLTARIDDQGVDPRWVATEKPEPPIDWAAEGEPIRYPGDAPINLRVQVGLRVWARPGVAKSLARFEFHHASCDGLAAIQFVSDFLVCYANACAGEGAIATLAELVPERLLERGSLSVDNPEPPSLKTAARDSWVTARLWIGILVQRCALLAAPRGPADVAARVGPSERIIEFETRVLVPSEAEQLRAAANSQGVTVNDLLTRDLLAVLKDWNQSHGEPGGRRLRISVPVNIRCSLDRDMPAANRIGFGFVEPEPRDFRDRATLLAAVRRQMDQIKQWKLGLYFLGGLAFASQFKSLIPWALHRNRSFATMVLSNLGRIFAKTPLPRREGRLICGDVELERLTGVPPIRPLTRGSFAIFEYAGEFAICLRCDPKLFRPRDCGELVDAYADRLRETARLGA
jgi:hypothetical protein